MESVGRKIVIHGGWDGTEVFNDLWIFNTDSFTWMQPKSAGFGPTPRFGHTLSLTADGRLIMFGGCSLVKESGVPRYHNDVRQLDTDTMIWTRPRINGTVPTVRYGHTASVFMGKYIVICGGWGTLGVQTSDAINNPDAHTLHCLDTETMTWTWIPKSGSKELKHLYNHAACISENSLYIYGGFDGRQASFDFLDIQLNVTSA